MTDNTICITQSEMVSSLGLDLSNACAAAHAGLIRLSPLNVMNCVGDAVLGPDPIVGHIIPCGISHGFVGVGKSLILGSHALTGLLKKRNFQESELCRTGIVVNLSDGFLIDAHAASEKQDYDEVLETNSHSGQKLSPSVYWKQQYGGFLEKLLKQVDLTIPNANQDLSFGGRSGFALALQNAVNHIISGRFDRCIVGAIDCCTEPQFLIAAAANGLLRTDANLNGFFPGEGAGFMLIEKYSDMVVKGLKVKSLIGGIAVDSEKINRLDNNPSAGIALTKSVKTVLEHSASFDQKIGLIIGDLNGDDHRAMEWGYVLVRLENKFSLAALPLWLPAINFGETGAVTGMFSVAMGIQSFQRGYNSSEGILVFLSGDNGEKAAISLFQID